MAGVFLTRPLGAAFLQQHDVFSEEGENRVALARTQGGAKGIHDRDCRSRSLIDDLRGRRRDSRLMGHCSGR